MLTLPQRMPNAPREMEERADVLGRQADDL